MRLGEAVQGAIKTICYYVPENQQDIRLALATFDAIRLTFDQAEVKTFKELRKRLGVKLPPADRQDELGDLF